MGRPQIALTPDEAFFIPVAEGKFNQSVVTVSRSLADLIRMHDRQAVGRETVDNFLNALDAVRIGEIDNNAHVGKTAHRSCAHAADNDGFNLGIAEELYRHHTAACLMTAIGNGRYAIDAFFRIKLNYRKNVTMAEVFRPFRIETAGIIGWDSNTHFLSPR